MPTNAKICSSPLATLATLAISFHAGAAFLVFPLFFCLDSLLFLDGFVLAVCAFYSTTRLTWRVTLLGSKVGGGRWNVGGWRPLATEYGN